MTTFQRIQSFRSQYFIEARKGEQMKVQVLQASVWKFHTTPSHDGKGLVTPFFFLICPQNQGYMPLSPISAHIYYYYLAAHADEWSQSTKHFMPWLVTDTLSQINNAAHTRNPNHLYAWGSREVSQVHERMSTKRRLRRSQSKRSSFLMLFISLFTHSCHRENKRHAINQDKK